jgi:hypothetical protein
MYEIETVVAPKSLKPIELDVEVTFRLKKAELVRGGGLVIHAAAVNGKSLLDAHRSLTSVASLLNLVRPTVEKGKLTFTICNPTTEPIWFKLTIK